MAVKGIYIAAQQLGVVAQDGALVVEVKRVSHM